ncbi:hypothetical protein VF14_34950 [Nostoc linckia z18]|uniref:DUF3887 domain-containing protein n=2 Tax=Nostoc linckia TaxID=92942 RepID=A0A9Q5Z4N6_NOSLI|nr:hypothetical protein [Nostoc linckia]PHK29305.1 hypothetical protein VF12_31350 [Nostoc linckia z15]PHK45894.1 hypothetical protein VF13_13520 [Nostoc linckia z16]PHJ54472.1 hypothetical protein VF02_36760 [Nostoc linckia z1]PHJ57087.1 hypothetical protein VF05_36405 [Nostoc linckia z3]PHJ71492.1 hypothetical protein VF06_37250 [Nostoc linckia z4]
MNKMAFIVAAVITMSPLTLAVANNVQPANKQVKQTQSNQPEQSVQKTFISLINAVEQNNYNQFISQGNAAFKEAVTKQTFTQVSGQLAPRLKKGYSLVFLGNLNQQGYQVYLWKLTFKDSGDDILARLSLKDGKIGGFWLN